MKKQNNISALARKAFYTALAVLFCTACNDNAWEDNSPLVKEGVPVSVNFRFETSSMEKISTRSLTEEQEWKMHDLYLFIFDKDGNKKKGTKYYTEAELTNHHNYPNNGSTGGALSVETTSGESYIYGIANVGANELGGVNIKNALDRVETIDDLKGIQVTLSSSGNIDRNSDNLVTSGTYKLSEESTETDGRCTILPTNTTLEGKLYLKRLDSHISFKIRIDNSNKNDTDFKITDYKFNSWQVFNVPVKSNLILQEIDAVDAESDENNKKNYFVDSGLQNQFITSKEGSTTFSFYMLENRRNAKEGISNKEYGKREEEEKKQDGKNHDRPVYKYADEYATYVEIKGELIFTKKDSNGNPTSYRYANVCYKVHLGYVGNDATDFKSERNKKYTYNMTIRDVKNIILEVWSEEGDEPQPGAEGDVVDANTQIYELDAHYNCFNIEFTWKEISEGSGFTFRVKTPFGEVDQDSKDKEAGDYQWIKFVRTDNKSTLASYPSSPDDIKYLFDLKEDMEEREEEAPNQKHYYTVFIDEYFYETPPNKNCTWNEPYWTHFVNKGNREALILLSPEVSKDGDSSYADARYLITQKSIQTYYSTTDLNNTRTALGIEHVNEINDTKEIPNMDSDLTNSPTWDKNNGAWNTWKYIETKYRETRYIERDKYISWEGYCNPNAANPRFYTFSMKDVKAWAECLSRNRDEDGDGEIDDNELKWYLPTDNQLASVFLGAPSLPNPIFDANKIPELPKDRTQYHYATSNISKVWSEEGCSFGGTSSKTLRCVRNLGREDGTKVKENVVSPAYTYVEDTRTFTMKMDKRNIRDGIIEDAEIPSHGYFSPNNRPYSKFQVAKNFAKDVIEHGTDTQWSDHFLLPSGKSVCAEYTEEDGENDRGSWRAPNQRELLIMYVQNPNLVINTKNGVKYGSYSCSNWKYDPLRRFGINTGLGGKSANPVFYLDSKFAYGPSTIRCVRDVK